MARGDSHHFFQFVQNTRNTNAFISWRQVEEVYDQQSYLGQQPKEKKVTVDVILLMY